MILYRQLDNVFSAFPACQSCMGIVSLPGFFRSPVWAYQWAALGSAPQKFSGLPVKRWGRRGGTGNPFWVFPMPMKVWGTGTPQPPAANRPLAGAIHAGWHLFPLGGTRRHTVPSENPYEILYCNKVAYGQVARKVRHTPSRFFIEIFVMDTVPPLLTSR